MTLLETLTENTQDLKKEYLEQTKTWADSYFDQKIKVLNWTEVAWCKYFNLIPRLANDHSVPPVVYDPKLKIEQGKFWSLPRGFYNTKSSREMSNMQNTASSMKRKGKDQFI